MKLSQWAQHQGITYRTAWDWFHNNQIPGACQYPTGTIIVQEKDVSKPLEKTIVYCRISTPSRKHELDYQVDRCVQFCNAKGLSVSKVIKEIASGMNDNRREFNRMLDLKPTIIVVENKDRLTRFGFNYLRKLLKEQGCEILVMNEDHEDETDLIKDMISIMTSFCCRLYGLRRGVHKSNKIKRILHEQEGS